MSTGIAKGGPLWLGLAAKGSLSEVHRRCGKASCSVCRELGGHRVFLFSYREEGRRRCVYIPAEAVPKLRQALANGRAIERELVASGAALTASFSQRKRPAQKGATTELAAVPRLRVGVLSELNILDATCSGYHRGLANLTVQYLRERGFDATLYCGTVLPGEERTEPTCPEFGHAVRDRNLDAAIILDVPSSPQWAARIAALPIPTIGYYTGYDAGPDLASMIRRGLADLRNAGSRRIALLTWERGNIIPCFEEAAAELNLETRQRWVAGSFEPVLPGSGWEAFREIWAAYPEKPDGLLVLDDVFFQGAAQAIHGMGIAVPGDLHVATHANRLTALTPDPLPCFRYIFDPADAAKALTDLLQRRLAGEPPPVEQLKMPFVAELPTLNGQEKRPCTPHVSALSLSLRC